MEEKNKTAKHAAYDLAQMQSLPLEAKVKMTERRIREWYEYWDGEVYVSFSGGKDSTVLLDIARRLYPSILAVYIDTGLEFPEIKQFVKRFENVEVLRPKMSFRQVLKKYGYPVISKEVAEAIYAARSNPESRSASKFDDNSAYCQKYGRRFSLSRWAWLKDSDIPVSHMCCKVMKEAPARAFEKKTGKTPILAMLAEESRRRQTQWQMLGCNAFDAKTPRSNPMTFWTEQDVLRYIKEHDLPIASVYGEIVESEKGILRTTGRNRTGCIFCMFGAHLEKSPTRFELLRLTHPQLWDYCMKPWSEGGLGLREVCRTCGIKTGEEE